MKRKILLQLVVPLLSLCVLFLLLAFDPGAPRSSSELLEISVLPREVDGTLWSAGRQGMEQAAADMGVELRFVTLSAPNHTDEQRELLAREVAGGADAVILVPCDRDSLAEDVGQAAGQTVVITMETDMSDAGASACISVDNTALGHSLGRAALNGVPAGGTVLLVDSLPGSNGVSQRLTAAAQLLKDEGRIVHVCGASGALDLEDALSAALAAAPPDAVIAFESSALELAARVVKDLPSRPLLYGMGSTSEIAACLEQGEITAIMAQNEFAAGYLAVDAAVQAIGNKSLQDMDHLAYTLVRKESMYTPENQKLLFPVTQ